MGATNGIPLFTIITLASESDQNVTMFLIDELVARYPSLEFACIIPALGYDAEAIHHGIDLISSESLLPRNHL